MTAKEKYDLKFGGANASSKVNLIVTEIKDNGSDLKDNGLNELVDNAIKEVIREDEKQEIFNRLNKVEVKKTDCAIDEDTKQEFENMEKNMKRDLTIQYHNEVLGSFNDLRKDNVNISNHQIAHRKEDFLANTKINEELKQIHKIISSKLIIVVFLLNAFVFTSFGAVLHANKDAILPYADKVLSLLNTTSKLTK